jgi:AcrR family transcriptional regulator
MKTNERLAGRSYKQMARLPDGTVSDAQRTRIISAMIDLTCEHGVESIAISRVVARARVSTRTFYELFGDRGDCLLAAIDHALALASERVRHGYESQQRWLDRVRAGLQELLAFFEDEPRLALLLVVHSAAAGPPGLALRARVLERLAQVLDEARADARAEPPVLTAEATVGGVLSVVHSRLLRRDTRELTTLLNPLMSMIVLPYMGAAAARRELNRPQPERRTTTRHDVAIDPLARDIRLTSRTLAVLRIVAAQPGLSNKEVSRQAGIADQGQISRLLARLCERGLLENTGGGQPMGAANAWRLTRQGERLERAVARGMHGAGL